MRPPIRPWKRPTFFNLDQKRSDQFKRRLRPRLEDLEARIAMAASALDPSFGQGGVVLGPLSGGGYGVNAITALAVQSDGKIVEAETQGVSSANPAATLPVQLMVRRFNSDGSADATFGTNGQTIIPLAASPASVSTPPRNLVIESDGSIVLAAEARTSATIPSFTSLVVRLTASGQLDPSFGTSGEVILPGPSGAFSAFNTVAVQGDGKIVAAGVQRTQVPTNPAISNSQMLVVRLTTTGALDTSFDKTGELAITLQDSQSGGYSTLTSANVAIAPNGQIYLASNIFTQYSPPGLGSFNSVGALSRINSDGTLDTSFGTSGNLSPALRLVNNIVIQPDSKVVLVGTTSFGGFPLNLLSYSALIRLLPSGAPDPTFRGVGVPSPLSNSLIDSAFTSVALAADGTITVGGTSTTQTAKTFIQRFLPNGMPDSRVGVGGKVEFAFTSPTISSSAQLPLTPMINTLALTSSGKVVVGGGISGAVSNSNSGPSGSQSVLAQILPISQQATPNDYNGDGKSDVAAELAAFATFAYRPSGGGSDVLTRFGPAGIGQAIPAPGDYDGDGKTDIAAYLPAYGVLAYRPSSGGPDVIVPFGFKGAGQSIPAPGDYDGDGKTDVAVYLPSLGIFAYRPSSGGPDVLTQFGFAGAGQSIPAPGDYNGDGRTDIAVYLPSLGVLAYRPSGGGADVLTQFGLAGAGQTIPAPGDYNGDGKTDIAAYLPSLGIFAVRPSGGGPDLLTQFGLKGAGQSIPAPGDYDGDGKTDLAVYLPSLGLFAYRPTTGGGDVIEAFGARGVGQTVPAASIPYAQPVTPSIASLPVASNAVTIPLTEDLLTTPPGSKKKHRA